MSVRQKEKDVTSVTNDQVDGPDVEFDGRDVGRASKLVEEEVEELENEEEVVSQTDQFSLNESV